tara:strand:- start:741 stop:851 length:111 start_codon:yes stop_codon:yes gene_type:complete
MVKWRKSDTYLPEIKSEKEVVNKSFNKLAHALKPEK